MQLASLFPNLFQCHSRGLRGLVLPHGFGVVFRGIIPHGCLLRETVAFLRSTPRPCLPATRCRLTRFEKCAAHPARAMRRRGGQCDRPSSASNNAHRTVENYATIENV